MTAVINPGGNSVKNLKDRKFECEGKDEWSDRGEGPEHVRTKARP